MNSPSVKPPEKSDLAKRMLEDLVDPSPRTDPKPAARPAPVVRAVESQPQAVTESRPGEPTEARDLRESRDTPRRESRRKTPASVARKIDIDVATGQGTRHLTLRVPKDLAGDLSMLAMKNKLEENGEPTTINELGIQALRRLLSEAA
jgi:hypothetical protein